MPASGARRSYYDLREFSEARTDTSIQFCLASKKLSNRRPSSWRDRKPPGIEKNGESQATAYIVPFERPSVFTDSCLAFFAINISELGLVQGAMDVYKKTTLA